MQKDKRFDYGGRSNDAAAKFISGECAMLTQSSGGLGAIARDAKFDFGTAQLPYWPDVKGAPYASTIGGASLWVFNAPNRTDNEFRGVARFLDFLRSDKVMIRQFFLTLPDELVEAAKIDGAGPLRFFWDVVLPLTRIQIAALFVILFVYGWNQYLWPLLIVTDIHLDTIVVGIAKMIGTGDAATDWNLVMATTLLALLPPALVVLLMQKWFVRGLVDSEK
jgi:ABC-type glycerol-3-phosphate transport system substrate-binding protein